MKRLYLILLLFLSFTLSSQTVKYTIAESSNAGYFTVNDVDYPKGHFGINYDYDITNPAERNITIYNIHEPKNTLITSRNYAEFADVSSWDELYSLLSNSGVLDAGSSGGATPTSPSFATLAKNDLGYDAWGRPKVVNDYTMFSGMWTYGVPNRSWAAYHMDTAHPELGFVEGSSIPKDNTGHVRSIDGHLEVESDASYNVYLQSKRHMRYQPNKGYLYSSAHILPAPTTTANWIRNFGMLSKDNGLYFELLNPTLTTWSMWAVRRTTVAGVSSDTKVDITQNIKDVLGEDWNPAKGHVYDIQAEWRGVGNIGFFVNLQLVYLMDLLGTLDDVSISNPALQVGQACFGDGAKIITGCVDVTSEGGYKSNKLHSSCSTLGHVGCVSTGIGSAMLAVKIPKDIIYNGDIIQYTRDLVLARLTAYAGDEYTVDVWMGRIVNNAGLDALTWTVNPDSYWEYIIGGNGSALDVAFQTACNSSRNDPTSTINHVYMAAHEREMSLRIQSPSPEDMAMAVVTGDIFIVSIESKATTTGVVTLEFAEEF